MIFDRHGKHIDNVYVSFISYHSYVARIIIKYGHPNNLWMYLILCGWKNAPSIINIPESYHSVWVQSNELKARAG